MDTGKKGACLIKHVRQNFIIMLKPCRDLIQFKTVLKALCFVAITYLAACSSYQIQKTPAIDGDLKWAILPLLNTSQTPMAQEKAQSILMSVLSAKGVGNIQVSPESQANLDILNTSNSKILQEGWTWVESEDIDYVITGTIEEWQYKSGLDGEPAVSMSLSIQDAKSKKVLWTGSGARVGWGWESTSITARKVVLKLFKDIVFVVSKIQKNQNFKENS